MATSNQYLVNISGYFDVLKLHHRICCVETRVINTNPLGIRPHTTNKLYTMFHVGTVRFLIKKISLTIVAFFVFLFQVLFPNI